MQEALKLYDVDYRTNEFRGQVNEDDVFRFLNRGSKVILSAPHATQTFINNQVKASDLYTGALVQLLGEKYNFSTILRRKLVEEKSLINEVVIAKKLSSHYFLDIHGMKAENPFELAVGTGFESALKYRKELEYIKSLANKYHISMIINHPNYRGPWGLTGFMQRHFSSKQILQLEWRLDMRDFYKYPDKVINQTIPFIADLAKWLEELPA